jgi:hypothetical protein
MMENPLKVRARQNRYTAKNRDAINAKSRAWYAANKERAKATRKAWRQRNADRDAASVAAYQEANRDRLKAAAILWAKRNADLLAAKAARHRATKLRATPRWANQESIAQMYNAARALSLLQNVDYHVDHIVPLRSKLVCGLHCEANLQILKGRENQTKSNRRWPDMPE